MHASLAYVHAVPESTCWRNNVRRVLPATGQSRAAFDLRETRFICLQAVDKLEAMSDQELLDDVLDALKKVHTCLARPSQ